MYAFQPGWGATPPATGTDFSASKLISYGNTATMNYYLESNNPPDMVWVNVGTKDSIAASFTYPLRGGRLVSDPQSNVTDQKDWTLHASGWYYGNKHPEGIGSKGYHGEPYQYAIMWYDPLDVIDAATPAQAQPYAVFDVSKYFYQSIVPTTGDGGKIGGIAYDATGGRLFVVESQNSTTGGVAIVHVFDVADTGTTLDATAPTAPSSLSITAQDATHANLSWTGSTDAGTDVEYVIYVNGYPAIRTTATSFDYTYVDEWAAGDATTDGWPSVVNLQFKIQAHDSYHNGSGFSNIVTHGFISNRWRVKAVIVE